MKCNRSKSETALQNRHQKRVANSFKIYKVQLLSRSTFDQCLFLPPGASLRGTVYKSSSTDPASGFSWRWGAVPLKHFYKVKVDEGAERRRHPHLSVFNLKPFTSFFLTGLLLVWNREVLWEMFTSTSCSLFASPSLFSMLCSSLSFICALTEELSTFLTSHHVKIGFLTQITNNNTTVM